MDLATGIRATAQALGMDPKDLATIISFETAGTFDPLKRGPTTKWGQHRGLIQFGEPQARQHGVNWDDPLGSQLGPDGAIARYFRSSGWQPGMSGLDAYSVVNAGAPGRYNASDTAAGGTRGNVRDKWESQMGDHRQKAAALLGGGAAPAATQMASAGPQQSAPPALAQMMTGGQPAPQSMMQALGTGLMQMFGGGGQPQQQEAPAQDATLSALAQLFAEESSGPQMQRGPNANEAAQMLQAREREMTGPQMQRPGAPAIPPGLARLFSGGVA